MLNNLVTPARENPAFIPPPGAGTGNVIAPGSIFANVAGLDLRVLSDPAELVFDKGVKADGDGVARDGTPKGFPRDVGAYQH